MRGRIERGEGSSGARMNRGKDLSAQSTMAWGYSFWPKQLRTFYHYRKGTPRTSYYVEALYPYWEYWSVTLKKRVQICALWVKKPHPL